MPWTDLGLRFIALATMAENDISEHDRMFRPEATSCSLGAGYFVRWVAADLVLAGDDTQKSKGEFTLWADGYEETKFTLKIVEPS